MTALPFRAKKIYYFVCTASLGLIAWVIPFSGETNLPPLIPFVRYVILGLYANWMMSYVFFVSDPGIEREKLSGWLWLAAIGVFLCLIPPVFSGDLNEYLIRGRMLGIYHVSPYQAIPNDFPNDLLRPYSIWVKNPDSYGPLSVYLQTLPAIAFPKSILGMTWAYKMMVLAFFGGSALFFWKLVHHLKWAKATQLWAMFAYCPLIVVTALIDGHNDVIMMALSVASIYFLFRKKFTTSFIFWTCAFLIKYMVFLQLPFMVLYAVKMKWRDQSSFPWGFVLKQLLLNLAIIFLCFAPLWAGEGTFLAILRQKDAFYTNTVPFLFHLSLTKIGWVVDQQIIKNLFLGGFAVFFLYLLVKSSKVEDGDPLRWIRSVCLTYLAFYMALPSPMGYWYLVWAIFWLVLARWPMALTGIVLYSTVGLLAFYKRPNFLIVLACILYIFFLFISKRRLCYNSPHE